MLSTPSLTVRPGDEVPLRFESDEYGYEFAWFVDAGELLGTGLTSHQGTTPTWTEEQEVQIWTQNVLRVPENYRGPLRVYVVTSQGYGGANPTVGNGWDMLTLQVEP